MTEDFVIEDNIELKRHPSSDHVGNGGDQYGVHSGKGANFNNTDKPEQDKEAYEAGLRAFEEFLRQSTEIPTVAAEMVVPRTFYPLLKPARYKAAYGGRGSGKSHFFAELLIRKAVNQPGLRWACVREIQKSLEQSAMRLIKDKIAQYDLGHLFDVRDKEIRTPGDGLIIFQGMQNHNAHSIKSLEGYDGCWVEEAHSLSINSWTILRPTFRREGSEIWASWNPTLREDPVDAFFRQGEPPSNSIIVKANWDSNPWFPDVLEEERQYDLRRDPDRYAHVWGGQYMRVSQARVFKNWRVEEFNTPRDVRFFYGADWGYADDPTVLIRCFIDYENRKLYVDQEAYQLHCELDKIANLFDKVPGAREWPIRADSSRPDTISFVSNKFGFNIVGADKGPRSVEDGIEFLKSWDIIVHPRCQHTADELSFYSWKTDPKTEEILPMLEDKHNHVIDSLRYALEGERKGQSMVDYL